MKILVLIVSVVLQLAFCSSFACELKIENQSNAVSSKINFEKNILTSEASTNHHQENNSQDTQQTHCSRCEICHCLNVVLFEVELNFLANEFYSAPFNYHFIYHQPHLGFSKKPPMHS